MKKIIGCAAATMTVMIGSPSAESFDSRMILTDLPNITSTGRVVADKIDNERAKVAIENFSDRSVENVFSSYDENQAQAVDSGQQGTTYWSTRTDSRWGLQASNNKGSTGAGTITSNPSGINCGSLCNESFHIGTSVVLTATPALGSKFVGWTGACTDFVDVCTVTMNADKSVTAIFDSDSAESLNEVYRFYNTATGTHFFTASVEEKNNVIMLLPTLTYEGVAFRGVAVGSNGGLVSPVYRFFNTATGTHFYTISESERDYVLTKLPGFTFEGEAYFAYASSVAGAKPLYRFFNIATGGHFYTVSETEKLYVQSNLTQYIYEGVAYYVE